MRLSENARSGTLTQPVGVHAFRRLVTEAGSGGGGGGTWATSWWLPMLPCAVFRARVSSSLPAASFWAALMMPAASCPAALYPTQQTPECITLWTTACEH